MILDKDIEHFESITLEEMNQVKLMDRIETKFVLSVNQISSLFQTLMPYYRVVSFQGEVMPTYNTVYYDTENLFFYREHHRKRNDRYKVRFRNYVDTNITFLEVKHKKNGRVGKQRIQVENENFTLNPDLLEFLHQKKINKQDLKISLENQYKRITLVSNYSIERVTFDFDIRFKYQNKQANLGKIVIIELKEPIRSRSSKLYHSLKQMNVLPYNLSKYCVGLIKTRGLENLKYNRFKKKLLKIDKINAL